MDLRREEGMKSNSEFKGLIQWLHKIIRLVSMKPEFPHANPSIFPHIPVLIASLHCGSGFNY